MGSSAPQQNYSVGEVLENFRLEKIEPISELLSTAYLFSHIKTGARLLHLFNDDDNNLFSIAFRTPVNDCTGVPHIMEHSVLCGSKKFPIKDPFQELLKGSLQTFLNALTYPDKTMYPVSSQVEKDFYNLVDVYCDAVFNPLLTENTFYQEGWHFDVDDPQKPVGIKGIVYNEMKGVYSNFSSHVDRKTLSALFPDNTYFFESGGEPEHITDLNYTMFREFHRKFYHPSNSFIFLYGNLPSEKSLRFLDHNFLNQYNRLEIDSSISRQKSWQTPKSIEIKAPAPKEDDGTATVVLVWLFGDTVDPVTTLAGKIMSHYLLGTESSPLKRALIDSGLGEDLDDFSGFDSEIIQTVFAAGLRKCKPENAQQIQKLILDTLDDQVKGGLDKELLEGALRQVEFSLREITSGHFPYNLRLAERCYRSWLYDGDPLAHLAFEKPLSYIKEQNEKGTRFFADLIQKKLLNNNHRLLSVIVASSEMGKQLEQQTEDQAVKLTSHFTQADKEHYHQLTKTLLQQQMSQSTAEALATLPKLAKSDLPRKGKDIPAVRSELDGVTLFTSPIFTSGVVYFDLGFNFQALPKNLIPYVPFYAELITRCGAAGFSYEENAKRIALSTGGIDASIACKTKPGTEDELFFYGFIHGKSMLDRFGEMLAIFKDLLLSPDLTNKKQIKDVLLEERNGLHSSIIGSGHTFAIMHASSYLSKSRYLDEEMGGISQLRFLDNLIKTDNIDAIVDAVKEIHQCIVNKNGAVISITADDPSAVLSQVEDFLDDIPSFALNVQFYQIPMSVPHSPKGIEINSAVNFVSKIWKLPPAKPQSAALQYLLSRHLSTGYLWDKVRVEGGAYGGMSMTSIAHPIFACVSYRDPNLISTLKHFENGIEILTSGIPQEKIDQSIIGAIGRIDSPQPPHAQGFGEALDQLMGYTKEFRQKLREAILDATSDDLSNTARQILETKESVITVLGGAAAFDASQNSGFGFEREPLLS